MRIHSSLLVTAVLATASVRGLAAQDRLRSLSVEGAITEAVQNNLALLAERANLSVADAASITARLRPNPVLSASAESLDWLGTGFDTANAAGPPQYSVRVDVPFERGGKRDIRIDVADQKRRLAVGESRQTCR